MPDMQIAAENDLRGGYAQSSLSRRWAEAEMSPLYHGGPTQGYSGLNCPAFQVAIGSEAYKQEAHTQPVASCFQSPSLPQWPSMLKSPPHTTFQPVYPPPVQPTQPIAIGALQTPVPITAPSSTSTPRRTLTDLDRTRMCQYAEEHPNQKQTEIGAIFGVDRSTVSKVLRNKEKYMTVDHGSRPPFKRKIDCSPSLERTLVVWAKQEERKGVPLTNNTIRSKAQAFSAATTTLENHTVLTTRWIEKFKHKYNLMGAQSQKSSLPRNDSEGLSSLSSSARVPSGISPVSREANQSPELNSAQSHECLENESPSTAPPFDDRANNHSQSNTSLTVPFATTAPSSSFSSRSSSPTTPPSTTPFSRIASNLTVLPLDTRPASPAAASLNDDAHQPHNRTRSPLGEDTTSVTDGYNSTAPLVTNTTFEFPVQDIPTPCVSIDEVVQPDQLRVPYNFTPADTIRPLPISAPDPKRDDNCELTLAIGTSPLERASHEDALQALETVMRFIEQQGTGFLSFQESYHLGILAERLRLQSQHGNQVRQHDTFAKSSRCMKAT